MTQLLAVLIAVLLLAGNAFFVGAEFSLITARRDRLETLVAQGRRRAQTVIDAGEHLSLMLAGSQLGITICSILLGRVGEPAVAHLIETPLHLVGLLLCQLSRSLDQRAIPRPRIRLQRLPRQSA